MIAGVILAAISITTILVMVTVLCLPDDVSSPYATSKCYARRKLYSKFVIGRVFGHSMFVVWGVIVPVVVFSHPEPSKLVVMVITVLVGVTFLLIGRNWSAYISNVAELHNKNGEQ